MSVDKLSKEVEQTSKKARALRDATSNEKEKKALRAACRKLDDAMGQLKSIEAAKQQEEV